MEVRESRTWPGWSGKSFRQWTFPLFAARGPRVEAVAGAGLLLAPYPQLQAAGIALGYLAALCGGIDVWNGRSKGDRHNLRPKRFFPINAPPGVSTPEIGMKGRNHHFSSPRLQKVEHQNRTSSAKSDTCKDKSHLQK
jgi:hypothetical protein